MIVTSKTSKEYNERDIENKALQKFLRLQDALLRFDRLKEKQRTLEEKLARLLSHRNI